MPAKNETTHPHVLVVGDDVELSAVERLRSDPHHHHGNDGSVLAHDHNGSPSHHHSMTIQTGALRYQAAVFGPADHTHRKKRI